MGKIQIPRGTSGTSGASSFRPAPRPFAPARPRAVQRKEGDAAATATLTDYLDTRAGERDVPVVGNRFGTPMAVKEKVTKSGDKKKKIAP